MKNLNRIELQGNVGNVKPLSGTTLNGIALSVATNLYYKDDKQQGGYGCDTTWHDVVAWEGNGIAPLDKITKGVAVHVVGRLRKRAYKDAEGHTRYATEVLAHILDIIDNGDATAKEEIDPERIF